MKFWKKAKNEYNEQRPASILLAASGAILITITFVHPVNNPPSPLILALTFMGGILLLYFAMTKYNADLAKFTLAAYRRWEEKAYQKAMREDDHT